ncbi:prepilin-type N-terminal cleavage/methylation domain-containing protein [Clostridium botulinum]|uniref:Prepilin cleavage protein n=3 Tax=Clostridium botulinum TaxID=1491 RepID=A0A0A0IMP9_CLOBO|nr:prepilin-type N-terminal cleavage/methylation domain-containing protein [Clostridium botulinum]KGM96878.1 prepilin cleavage protein [Clostridium botulinum D str. CCUG 7971]KGN01909.1 prepilin cleavage protein [Clostridium botulinum C/D str. DC5]KOC48545.1 prepilin cleavage protein [Clostridium botulinum]KOC55643.1 prepilin cleavage protein [Clostridium botulinum]KOC57550.1 prepilin cleavage protein [Clostridium botulinum]
MSKLSKKSGLSLIEVICALAILCTASAYICNAKIKTIWLKNYNENIKVNIELSENLKNNLKYNYTYEELQQLFSNKYNKGNKLYINKEKLNSNNLKTYEMKDIVSNMNNGRFPYAEIFMENEERDVVKVVINLKLKIGEKLYNINSYFYKGDY